MAKQSEDHTIQCPYYKSNNPCAIYCEGLEEGMTIHMAFATRDLLISYKNRFCRSMCYQQCPVAEALNKKWGV